MPQPTIFISYSQKDEKEKDALVSHLKVLQQSKLIDLWSDDRVGPGSNWEDEITLAISQARVAVLLITANYLSSLNSEPFLQKEVPLLLHRRQNEGLVILPLIARACAWEAVDWLRQMSARPKNRQPVWSGGGSYVDENLTALATEIKLVIEGKFALSEDGELIPAEATLAPPAPEFDPAFLGTLKAPGGAVEMRDHFYIERNEDERLKREMVKPGTTIIIRAPRQTGKTSLLIRGLSFAEQHGAKSIHLQLQRLSSESLTSYDTFLRQIGLSIFRTLDLDLSLVEIEWRSPFDSSSKLTNLIEDHVLAKLAGSIILAIDEADRLMSRPFSQDFFGLVRAWHESRPNSSYWSKLNLVMVISTEPALLIEDVYQSPFNVGLPLKLEDFNIAQVRILNQRHGFPLAESQLSELMALLNGHPYLTRQAFYCLVTEPLTWAELVRIATNEQGPFGNHLRGLYGRLQARPELGPALKQIIRSNHCSNETALLRLLRAGLVKGSGNIYECRCDLYRRYFEGKL